MSTEISRPIPSATVGFGVGSATNRKLTPVTYYPVPLQKQFYENQKTTAGKPYAVYFTADLDVSVAWAKALQHGPLSPEHILTPSVEDINKILDPERSFPGCWLRRPDGPSAYTQSRIEMPGVTTEMFKWWFTWHPQEKQRYMLWSPHSHIDNYCEKAARLADTSLL